MGKTLTVVACAPPPAVPTTANEPDFATRALLEKLERRPDPTHHVVERAASVRQIALALEKHRTADGGFDRIQFVGHGRRGTLDLGWTYIANAPARGAARGEAFWLDSAPNVYSMLYGAIRGATKVYVLGCQVGAESPPDSDDTDDGPTLLFDLARLWRVEVHAPVDLIDADDYDANGVIDHPSRLTVVTPQGIASIGTPRPLPPLGPTFAPTPVVVHSAVAPQSRVSFRRAAPDHLERHGDDARARCHTFEAVEVAARHAPLAATEAILGVELEGQRHNADVIAGGSMLRVTHDARVRLFRVDGEDGGARVRRAVRSLVAKHARAT